MVIAVAANRTSNLIVAASAGVEGLRAHDSRSYHIVSSQCGQGPASQLAKGTGVSTGPFTLPERLEYRALSVPPAKVGCAIERALLADGHTSVWVGAVSSMEVKDDALGIT